MCRLYGCNVCGEGGEYETLVLDCALFTHARIVMGSWSIEHLSAGEVAILHPTDFYLEPKTSPQALQGMPQGDPIHESDRSRSSTVAPGNKVQSSGAACTDMPGQGPAEINPEAASTAAQSDGEDAGSLSGHDSGCPPARAQVYMVPPQSTHSLASPAAQEQSSSTAGTGKTQLVAGFWADAAFIRSSHALSVSCAPRASGRATHVPACDLAEAAVHAALAEITQGRTSRCPSPVCGTSQQPAPRMTKKVLCMRSSVSSLQMSVPICSLELMRSLVPSSSNIPFTLNILCRAAAAWRGPGSGSICAPLSCRHGYLCRRQQGIPQALSCRLPGCKSMYTSPTSSGRPCCCGCPLQTRCGVCSSKYLKEYPALRPACLLPVAQVYVLDDEYDSMAAHTSCPWMYHMTAAWLSHGCVCLYPNLPQCRRCCTPGAACAVHIQLGAFLYRPLRAGSVSQRAHALCWADRAGSPHHVPGAGGP